MLKRAARPGSIELLRTLSFFASQYVSEAKVTPGYCDATQTTSTGIHTQRVAQMRTTALGMVTDGCVCV
jgi:hypothetical protein